MKPAKAAELYNAIDSDWAGKRRLALDRIDGEPKATSLLFHIDTEEHTQSTPREYYHLWMSARMFFTPQTKFEERLLEDVRYYKAELLREEGQVDIVVLASHLATIGYKVALRTAVGGGSGQNCFRNLCYQFLLVSGNDSPIEHVVDPKFREQFAISQSTQEYEKLLSLIPGEFVGTSTRLKPLVKLLCMEMEQAFQETGLTWPPWRQAESMMSKWLPSRSQDTQIDSPTNSPRASSKTVDGKSPTGPLSYCSSSRASSTSGHSPDRLREVMPRRYSIQAEPKRVQKGFNPSKVCRSNSVPITTSKDSLRPQKSARHKMERNDGNIRKGELLRAGDERGNRQALEPSDLEWQPRIRTVKMAGAS